MKRKNFLFIVVILIISALAFCACNYVNPNTNNNQPVIDSSINNNKDTSSDSISNNANQVLNGEQIYNKIKDCVVEILTFQKNGNPLGQGSGFFVSNNEICTNYHVIENAYKIAIKLPNGESTGLLRIVGYNPLRDIASIRLTDFNSDHYLEIDTSSHNIGEEVYTLGSSEGLTGTFSNGIISHNDRIAKDIKCYQITAPISHGNSGGPMVSNQGKVIGINSMSLVSGQNLNFAIKINEYVRLDKSKNLTCEDFYNQTIML